MTEPPQSDAEHDRALDAPTLEGRVEGWVHTLIADSMLRPLYAVLLGHGVAFFAPILLFAFRDRSAFGLAGIAILMVASGSVVRRDWQRYGRPGPIGGSLIAIWLLSVVAAVVTDHYGFL